MSIQITGDVLFDIARGEMEGYSLLYKYGQNPAVTSDAGVQVWSKNEAYTYPAAGKVMYLSGSNVSDTTEVTVYGLDSDYVQKTSVVNMNGQSAVQLVDSDSAAISFYRVFRAFNSGSTDLSSDAYISDSDATLTGGVPGAGETYLMIDYWSQQTLHAMWTVPQNCNFYPVTVNAAITAETPGAISTTPHGVELSFRTREPGGVFRVRDNFSLITLGNGVLDRIYPMLAPLPEGTDLELYIRSATTTMGVDGSFMGIIQDTSVI